jgi:RNA polymerase sigma-70 factor (ECF subfamily)
LANASRELPACARRLENKTLFFTKNWQSSELRGMLFVPCGVLGIESTALEHRTFGMRHVLPAIDVSTRGLALLRPALIEEVLLNANSSNGLTGKPPSTRASLLARLRTGADVDSWRLFVDLYTPLIYRYSRMRGLQDADAEDVVQQVMKSIHGAIGRFEYDPGKGRFRHWLGTITFREIRRHRSRDRRPGKGTGLGGGDVALGQLAASEEGDWIDTFNAHILTAALARVRGGFDEATWQAFDWTWLQNLAPQEAAARLGKTTAWVYRARFKVLKQLRAEVDFLTEDAAVLIRPI